MLFASAICVVKIIQIRKGKFQLLESQKTISHDLQGITKNHLEHHIFFEQAVKMGSLQQNDKSLKPEYDNSVKSFRNSCEDVQGNITATQNNIIRLMNSRIPEESKNGFVKINAKISDINNHHSLCISHAQNFFDLIETGINSEAKLKAEAVIREEKYLNKAIIDVLEELKVYSGIEINRYEEKVAADTWLLIYITMICLITGGTLSLIITPGKNVRAFSLSVSIPERC
jgi:hypothetical protein